MTHFGGYLSRLLAHRGIRPDELPGVPELPAVLAGAAPTVDQLDLLAPVLGFHAADLYLMAGLPEAPAYRASGGNRWRLVPAARVLSPERLARVVELADGLPREPVEPPPGPVPRFDPRVGGFGAVLVNLLWCGRNMRPRDIQWALVTLTDVGLSQPTIFGVAQRPDSLTPEIAAGLGTVLGFAPGDVAAMAGLPLPGIPYEADPRAAELADLLWRCRDLTTEQGKAVTEAAEALLVQVPPGAPAEEWNRVYARGDVWWGAPKEWTVAGSATPAPGGVSCAGGTGAG